MDFLTVAFGLGIWATAWFLIYLYIVTAKFLGAYVDKIPSISIKNFIYISFGFFTWFLISILYWGYPFGIIINLMEKKTSRYKYPEDLINDLEKKGPPDIYGSSNYIWNHQISSLFCKVIKEKYPKTQIVMGGPNFPTNKEEQHLFLQKEPWIDFYIIKEGEYSLLKLVQHLMDKKKTTLNEVPNLVYLKKNKFFSSEKIERIMDLSLIPSPYLSGRLDSFLDGKLMPVIQTNRGCPFSCTFCTEGQTYWSKVRRKDEKVITEEIRRISSFLTNQKNSQSRSDLLIADSNFGMFNEDIKTCEIIANQQKTKG